MSGLIGLIGNGSTPPLNVETAASTLCVVLLGRSALAATKTLREEADAAGPAAKKPPSMVVGEALLAWKTGDGLMEVCGALVAPPADYGSYDERHDLFSLG